MKEYAVGQIRNICLLGHGGSGKTSLAEAILHSSGASERFGRVVDGTTVTDFDTEEIKRKISISTSLATFDWKGHKINLMDTPGYLDFVGEVKEAVEVTGGAVIVISGKSGLTYGVERAWNSCIKRKIPKIMFINKVDDDRVNFQGVLEQLRDKFGKCIAPFQMPIKEGDKIIGFVDTVHLVGKKFEGDGLKDIPIPESLMGEVTPIRDMILETVAETDEVLMDKFFNGEEFTQSEISKALRKGVENDEIVPVMCGSAIANAGVSVLMDAIVDYFPSPDEVRPVKVDGEEIKLDQDGPTIAYVFKTVADPFVGKISYFKVLRGSVKSDMTLINATTGKAEKIGKIFYPFGKKQLEAGVIHAGDIAAICKLSTTKTGETLCKEGNIIEIEKMDFPKPVLTMAIVPKNKGDEEKINSGLHKLMEEDLTFEIENNYETHQQLLRGVGEQHLDILVAKLKTKFGVEVELIEPKTAYRETIRKKVKEEGKHKKQSGGHGQFGHVWIEFEPGDTEELIFEQKVVGGSVPKNYFPAVEKGLQECIGTGVLAGYPVVFLKATLLDGSYHPVDSSEMAFKMAAHLAFKKGIEAASPVILEPIGHLEVAVPDALMGDVIGDINKRRGRVIGMNTNDNMGEVVAEVPMSEMHKYATDLRSLTQGRCKFSFEFVRYEDAPTNVAEKVIAESKK